MMIYEKKGIRSSQNNIQKNIYTEMFNYLILGLTANACTRSKALDTW